jgi:CRISPR-associated protein Csb1
LESACWDEEQLDLVSPLKGLPYVRVVDVGGHFLTASLLEAHRLNSAYIANSDLQPSLVAEIGHSPQAARAALVRALLKYDPNSLLHGIFFPKLATAGSPRLERAVSGFIEGANVSRVQTGGVKNDGVRASKSEDEGRTADEGFGNIPFHRTDFVAETLTAYFNIDLDQIRGYRLGDDVNQLLFALAVFKVRKFLESGLRLRTFCDLEAVGEPVLRGGTLPSLAEAEAALPGLIKEVASTGVFANPPVTVATFSHEKPAKKAAGAKK